MVEQRDPHTGLHSAQGALAGEHPGRVANPVVKVHDLAWLEFEKPDLERAELFARAFGFTTVPRTAHELQLRGTDAGAPCVLIRKGPRSRFVGTAFRAADPSDVVRLADATGRTVAALPESLGGVGVDLVDPSGARVRVVADPHELPALPGQEPLSWNVGHAVTRTNATQRPPRAPALVQRLGHVVLQSNRYVQTLDWYLQHLGLIVSDFLYYAGQRERGPVMSFIRCDRGVDPDRPPHAGDGAGPVQPVRALRLPGVGPGRAGRGRGVPARAGLPPVLGDRAAHPGQPDLRLLARPGRVPRRALQRRRPVRQHPRARLGPDDRLRAGPVGAARDQGLPGHHARPRVPAGAARDRPRAARRHRVRPAPRCGAC